MPKYQNIDNIPEKHRILSAEQEETERAMHAAEEENRDFYERNLVYTRNITMIQTGVRDDIARTLMGGVGTQGLVDRLLEERVQSELYRAVKGRKLYETENTAVNPAVIPPPPPGTGPGFAPRMGLPVGALPAGVVREDIRNYEESLDVEYKRSGRMGKLGLKLLNSLRGGVSFLGGNNFVEAEVARRFGPNRALNARRLYVANLMDPLFRGVYAVNPAAFHLMASHNGFRVRNVAAGETVDDYLAAFINHVSTLSLSRLRALQAYMMQPALPFGAIPNSAQYLDLLMLADLEQREQAKVGAEGIYDCEGLRQWCEQMLSLGGPQARLIRELQKMLVENSLFPLNKLKPDGLALVAEIRSRWLEQVARLASPPNNRGAVAADIVEHLLYRIRTEELPDENKSQDVIKRETEVNKLNSDLVSHRNSLTQFYSDADTLIGQIATIQASIAAGLASIPPAPANIIAGYNTDLHARQQDQRNLINNVISTEQEYLDSLAKLLPYINNDSIDPAGIRNEIGIYTSLTKSTSTLLKTSPFPATPGSIHDHIVPGVPQVETLTRRILGDVVKKEKLTPFVLLQRLMRRRYLAERHQQNQPDMYSEEANKQALMMASLRVKDAQNMNVTRSGNDKAAEFVNRSLIARGVDRLTGVIAKSQGVVGLEAIEFKNLTEDALLDALVNSDEDFVVFKGVNKFTSTRDVQEIINKSGREVAPEVVERFAATLQEALSRYKKVRPDVETNIKSGDWDLENLVNVFQKVKIAMWTNNFLAKVEKSNEKGNREQVLINLLKKEREEEKKISDSIMEGVKDSDVVWRKLLVKSELKKALAPDYGKFVEKGIERKNKELAKLEAKLSSVKDDQGQKLILDKQIENIKNEISAMKKDVAGAKNLKERVDEAKKYIVENKLSRSEKKQYLEQVGLKGVFDKMSTNFAFERGWNVTKAGMKKFWGGTKKTWAWSRKHIINRKRAGQAWSLTRIGARPITSPLKWFGKATYFPFWLTGKAISGTAKVPGNLWRMVSNDALIRHVLERRMEIDEDVAELNAKIEKLKKSIDDAPFRWDKRRINARIRAITLEKAKLVQEKTDLDKKVSEAKVTIPTV